MKNIFKYAAVVLLAATFTHSFTSCKKDDDDDAGTPPIIKFATDTIYTSADKTVPVSTTLLVGVIAVKSEGDDIITKLTETVRFDAATTDSTVMTTTVPAAQGDSVFQAYTINTRSHAGTEKYTFTAVDKDGVINSKTITLTVQ